MHDRDIVIEIIGEGKADIGALSKLPGRPDDGVVPILVFKLCGQPSSMQVLRKPLPQLQGKSLSQKVQFAKRQAYYNKSAGVVFVVDTEGEFKAKLRQLRDGRDWSPSGPESEMAKYPAAVGVAHPCVEAWLMTDAGAIQRALDLKQPPTSHAAPESLPAPCREREQNPKELLGKYAGRNRPLAAKEMTRIAIEIRDLDKIRERCPMSFAPFADEILERIRPIFETATGVVPD